MDGLDIYIQKGWFGAIQKEKPPDWRLFQTNASKAMLAFRTGHNYSHFTLAALAIILSYNLAVFHINCQVFLRHVPSFT